MPAFWRSWSVALAVGVALAVTVPSALAQGAGPMAFDTLLRAHVKNGVVDYPGFQDSVPFKSHVAGLAAPAKLDSKAETIAFHVNAYNALAIQGILDGLSPASVLGRVRYFTLQDWAVNGGRISLHDLEHKVLRPLGDPRIHFAIVCASRSCPPLRPETYTAGKLDAQLDEQARLFVNDTFRNRFDKATKTAHLSEIFKWYDEDFRGAGSVQRYIARYATDPEVAEALMQDRYKVDWIAYDWTLNGAPPRR